MQDSWIDHQRLLQLVFFLNATKYLLSALPRIEDNLVLNALDLLASLTLQIRK